MDTKVVVKLLGDKTVSITKQKMQNRVLLLKNIIRQSLKSDKQALW